MWYVLLFLFNVFWFGLQGGITHGFFTVQVLVWDKIYTQVRYRVLFQDMDASKILEHGVRPAGLQASPTRPHPMATGAIRTRNQASEVQRR
jgi:hypothetical protein